MYRGQIIFHLMYIVNSTAEESIFSKLKIKFKMLQMLKYIMKRGETKAYILDTVNIFRLKLVLSND